MSEVLFINCTEVETRLCDRLVACAIHVANLNTMHEDEASNYGRFDST